MKSLKMDLRWLLTVCAIAAVCALICFVPQARATGGTVSGCAYVDANENLTHDESEQLITGVPVCLERREGSAWTEADRTETDLYGKYDFTGLPSGEYRVICTLSGQELYAISVGTSMEMEDGAVCGEAVMLENEKTISGGDVGLAPSARLALTVFQDSNGDGKRGDYDRGVPGIEVTLMDGETALGSTSTDGEGKAALYTRSGRYTVRVALPAGYGLSDGSVQSHIIDLDVTFDTGEEESLTLAVAPVGALGGKVFEDLDNDGIRGEDEPGVAGVTVHIEGSRTGTVREITTDETGVYLFDFLPDDTYTISATLPDGMLYARYSQTGGDLRSIFTGSNITREFPLRDAARLTDKNIGVVENGVISGIAFLDLNYNGRLDEGEPGYAGVTLEALRGSGAESQGKVATGEDGSFRLEGLRGGEYQLRAILPNDGSIFSVTGVGNAAEVNLFEQRSTRREFTIGGLTLGSGGETSALVGVARTASVSGVVFEDAEYDGVCGGSDKRLSGIKVNAVDASGQTVATATTNAKGEYTLTGIMPGVYTVQVQRKAGYGFTRLRPEEDGGSHVTALVGEMGMTAEMDIAMGEDITGVNAGMLPASTVSGVFFHDVNDNGLRDESELGMLSAQVRLLSEDGEIDLVQTPGEDGTYFFDGVMPGRYTLHYLLKEHCEMARVAEGGNTVAHAGLDTVYGPFEVVMGESLTLPMAGAVTLGNFTGAVFEDLNANGQWDEGEKALSGAKVDLTPDRTGVEAAQAVTGADGSFDLEGLRPAGYTLTVTLPEGYIFSRPLEGLAFGTLGEQSLVCAWQTLTDRKDKAIGAVQPGSISGVIWLDENEDGQRGEGEMLMSNVSLELVDEQGGTVVKRTASTDQGFRFDNVRPGTYTVRLTLPEQSSPAEDSTSTFVTNGLKMTQTGVAVAAGEDVDGLTTGLVSTTSVAGRLYLDENGARTPLAGVTVSLYKGGELSPLMTVLTDDSGRYRFDGLWPADYYLEAGLPSGTIFVRPDDPNYAAGASAVTASGEGTGTSELFYLHMAQHRLDMDVIYIKPARVGDLAWLDENGNGLVDEGEPGIPGITVRLTQDGEVAYETVTDAYGYYLFTDVYPGTYTLVAQAYPELTPTKQVEALRIISSCLTGGDGTEAHSDPFEVESGSLNVNFDLGYLLREGESLPSAITAPPTRDWTISNTKAQ
ncbi:MAG: carboxypeptidase regulatory-like domain-containing protein [Clostridiales bacterium]|nr:carboxypeptidase regulatory-like domain-containing protein [Clostridiales bacterium]